MTTAQSRAQILLARRRQAHRNLISAARVTATLAAAVQPDPEERATGRTG